MAKKTHRLVQVVGKRLDPNAKYLFMFDGNTPHGQIVHFRNEMNRLMGNNFAIIYTDGDPHKRVSVYEITSEEQAKKETLQTVPNYKVSMPEDKPAFFRQTATNVSTNERIDPFVDRPAPTAYAGIPADAQPNSELSENEA